MIVGSVSVSPSRPRRDRVKTCVADSKCSLSQRDNESPAEQALATLGLGTALQRCDGVLELLRKWCKTVFGQDVVI